MATNQQYVFIREIGELVFILSTFPKTTSRHIQSRAAFKNPSSVLKISANFH